MAKRCYSCQFKKKNYNKKYNHTHQSSLMGLFLYFSRPLIYNVASGLDGMRQQSGNLGQFELEQARWHLGQINLVG